MAEAMRQDASRRPATAARPKPRRAAQPSPRALLDRSARYGSGAMARRKGLPPVPGRTGLLARIQDALSPSEVQSRLFTAIRDGRIPSFPALAGALPLARMRLVVRAYGKSISTYFVGTGATGGTVPARAVASSVTASAVARANSGGKPSADAARSKVADLGRAAEYRNAFDTSNDATAGTGFTSTQQRQISSGLRDNRNWTEIMQWLGAQTANITPRLRTLPELRTKNAGGHSWTITDARGIRKSVTMEGGLHMVVASGYAADGTRATGGAGSRTTFMGRRVDVLTHDAQADRVRLDALALDWGAALVADYGLSPDGGSDAVQKAIGMGCPVDMDDAGRPRARLVHDQTMRAGGSVLLAASTLGFRDVGRPVQNSTKPGWLHPDNLETIFGQTYDGWADEVATRSAPRVPRPAMRPHSVAVDNQADAFGLEFGQKCVEVTPANTAIVFHNARSSRFTLVSRATGIELPGVPARLGISNLPQGTYLRLGADEFDAWKSQGVDTAKRMSLGDAGAGRTVHVEAGGTLSHRDALGRLHNPMNGPSVVYPLRDEGNKEDTPTPVAWHHEGVEMSKEGFEGLRSRLSAQARALEEEAMAPILEDTFGLRAEGITFPNC